MNDYRRSFELREVADKKGYLVRYLNGFRSLLVPSEDMDELRHSSKQNQRFIHDLENLQHFEFQETVFMKVKEKELHIWSLGTR